MGPEVPVLSSYVMMAWFMGLLHKDVLVIMYGCTRDNEQGLWIWLIN